MSRISIVLIVIFLSTACNNSANKERSEDSTDTSTNAASGQNYIMENNVKYEKKKMDTSVYDDRSIDSIKRDGGITIQAADTAMVAIDTLRRY